MSAKRIVGLGVAAVLSAACGGPASVAGNDNAVAPTSTTTGPVPVESSAADPTTSRDQSQDRPLEPGQEVAGFVLPVGSGYVRTDISTSRQPVVPGLGYEQAVLQSGAGSTVSVSISSGSSEFGSRNDSFALSDGVAAGFVAVGHDYVDVLVRGDDAGADRDAIVDIARSTLDTAGDDLAALGVPGEDDGVSVERSRLIAEVLTRLAVADGMSLVDNRSRHESEVTDVTTASYSNGDRSITVTWRAVDPSLSLEVAAGPLATDFLTASSRLYATVAAYTGQPARVSWLQGGYFVTVSAGTTPSEAEQIASLVEPADRDRMHHETITTQAAIDNAPIIATHRAPTLDAEAELRTFEGNHVLCWVAAGQRTCNEADLLATATWFDTDDHITIVGAYPASSDPVDIEIDGQTVRPVGDDGYDWIIETVDRKTEFTFSITVGHVPTQTITVAPPPER